MIGTTKIIHQINTMDHRAFLDDLTGIGTAVAGVAGMVGNIYGAKKQLQAQRETNAFNLQLAKAQNDWNVQQWQREAEWDSTVNQLARWKAAGLNPNFYADSASSVATAPHVESADLANQVAPDIGQYYSQIGSSVQSAIDLGIRARQVSKQNEKVSQEVVNLKSENEVTKKTLDQVIQNIAESKSREDVNKKTLDELTQTISKMQAEQDVLKVQVEYYKQQANLAREQAGATREQANKTNLEYQFMVETWDLQKSKMKIENALNAAKIKLTSQQIDNLAEELQGIIINNGLKGNEMLMTEYTNWITRVTAMSEAYKAMNEEEKAMFWENMYGLGSTLIEGLNNPDSGKTVRDRLKRRARRYIIQPGTESTSNPKLPTP